MNPFNSEPPNGDYVRYLENLQNEKLRELHSLHIIPAANSDSGMVTVQTGQEIQDKKEHAAAELTALDAKRIGQLKKLGAVLFLMFGLAMMALGMFGEIEEFIPIGMFALFFGTILTSKAYDKRSR